MVVDNPCADLLRHRDPDRFHATLFAPAAARPDLWVLYALHAELEALPDRITEPLLGQMRFAWWRERIDTAASGTPEVASGHPIADPLAALLARRPILADPLQAALAARMETAFATRPFPTLAEMIHHARVIGGGVERAAARCLLADDAGQEAAARVGTARSLLDHLAAARRAAARGRCLLPARHDTGAAGLVAALAASSPSLADPDLTAAVMAVVVAADEVLDPLFSLRTRVDRRTMAPLLQARLLRRRLAALRRVGGDLACPAPWQPRPRPLDLAWALARGRL